MKNFRLNHVMRTSAFVAATAAILSYGIAAQAAVNCSASAADASEQHVLPGAGYWMQAVDSEGTRLTYTGIGGVTSYLYNLKEQKPEAITDDFDAFPIPPGDIYVHPIQGYSFYRLGDGAGASPIYVDDSRFGVYQSIGLLPGPYSLESRRVRIAAGWAAGIFQDYQIDRSPSGEYRFEKRYANPVRVCRNLPSRGLDSQLPVLSRDGQMISSRDETDQFTKIWRILAPESKNATDADCEHVQTIPTQTGKISFSFSGKSAMFVMADPNTGLGRLLEIDIATGEINTLSLPSEDVMYMTYRFDSSFRNDNAILYSRRRADESSDLVGIKPGAVPKATDALAVPMQALGHLWASACNLELDDDYARAAGSRLKKSECREVINAQSLSALGEDYSALRKEALLDLCERDDRGFSGITR